MTLLEKKKKTEGVFEKITRDDVFEYVEICRTEGKKLTGYSTRFPGLSETVYFRSAVDLPRPSNGLLRFGAMAGMSLEVQPSMFSTYMLDRAQGLIRMTNSDQDFIALHFA